MNSLTVQIFHSGQWHDAAKLDVLQPEIGLSGPVALEYLDDYALAQLDRDDLYACSLRLPVQLMLPHRNPHWFGFLQDIMPAGSSRQYWVNQLSLGHLPQNQQDFPLLQQGTISPVGNLRVKESVASLQNSDALEQVRFSVTEVADRQNDFLEYAQQRGAASGGATGAGGEAPKLLLRASAADEVWVDGQQDNLQNQDTHYLVKFPRGRRTDEDCDLLRAEYFYYQELHRLGVDTIDCKKMKLVEGERHPSLWLPRFDVSFESGQMQRFGLESVYSLLDKPAGAHLRHEQTIEQLLHILSRQQQVQEQNQLFSTEDFVVEWIKRDFLNVVFGNSDNHGRNTSLIKKQEGIWLSPVYDFAPMKYDPEGIIRSTRWNSDCEQGFIFDWYKIAQSMSIHVDSERTICELKSLAQKLQGLRGRLEQAGAPVSVLNHTATGLSSLDQKMKDWNLL